MYLRVYCVICSSETSMCKHVVYVKLSLRQQRKKKKLKHDQTDGGKWLFGEIKLTNIIRGMQAKNKMLKKKYMKNYLIPLTNKQQTILIAGPFFSNAFKKSIAVLYLQA